jgi:glycosyltransferase involved in cell wall biosynthesis
MTKLVAAQMRLQDGVEAGVADGPTDFAERCAQLLREPDHWSRIQREGLKRIRRDFGQEAFCANVLAAVAAVVK